MDRTSLTAELKSEARRQGFDLAGCCPATTPAGLTRFHDWLDRGYDGEMHYFRDREGAYSHPSHVLPPVRSLMMLTMEYRTAEPTAAAAGQGRVSRYAWGDGDYHDVIHDRLKRLAARVREIAPHAHVRGVVDSAPLLEREFARLAGVGWIGKNTMLINKHVGSWFFLAALLTDLELEYDEPHEADHCGTCRACLDACPTQSFPQPYVLDATKCISYLTIELREHIPREQREGIGEWLFGCDICNDVCPWNQRKNSPASEEGAYWPVGGSNLVDLLPLFQLEDATFRARFRDTAMWRPRRRGLLRNAAIVLGNQRASQAVDALSLGLQDPDSVVRVACAWALGQIGSEPARATLQNRLALEADVIVREEIQHALGQSHDKQ